MPPLSELATSSLSWRSWQLVKELITGDGADSRSPESKKGKKSKRSAPSGVPCNGCKELGELSSSASARFALLTFLTSGEWDQACPRCFELTGRYVLFCSK